MPDASLRAANSNGHVTAAGRLESPELPGTGRSRRAGKLAGLAPAVQPIANIRGVADRLREHEVDEALAMLGEALDDTRP